MRVKRITVPAVRWVVLEVTATLSEGLWQSVKVVLTPSFRQPDESNQRGRDHYLNLGEARDVDGTIYGGNAALRRKWATLIDFGKGTTSIRIEHRKGSAEVNYDGISLRPATKAEIEGFTREPAVIKEKPVPAPILKYFEYAHLPVALQTTSREFYNIARMMDASLPDSAEKSAGLRKLLEAKDCMVRAAME